MQEPTVDVAKVVRAQFDPSNQIPVLRLVPSPTLLAQNPTTFELDKNALAPQPCEGPTTKQCLQLVSGGWPITTPITLFFTGEVDEESVLRGVQIFKKGSNVPVPFEVAAIVPRPAPPADCQEPGGGNGSQLGYGPEDVPPGYQVVLTPNPPLEGGTDYVLLATSSEAGGLRSAAEDPANRTRVEPAALFHLLNAPASDAPVGQDGELKNPLLRQNVVSAVLAQNFDGKTEAQLDATEKELLKTALTAAGMRLFGLYQFFNAIIDPLTQAGVKRGDIVFVNAWHTAGAPDTVIEFDPAAQKLPFPNSELLTVTSTLVPGGLRVNLPMDPRDSPTAAALKMGLNTLNGFSTTAPMAITASRDVDPASIDPTPATPCTADDCLISVRPLDANGMIEGDLTRAVPLIVRTATATELAPATIAIVPAIPLLPNKQYVVAVRAGITDMSGKPVKSAQTFDLLKWPGQFINDMGDVNGPSLGDCSNPDAPTCLAFEQVLQCSIFQRTGSLGTDQQVTGTAAQLERDLMHARWLRAFTALESGSPALPRTELLMAWTVKTQSIVDTVDGAKAAVNCAPGFPCYEDLLAGQPRVLGPLATFTGTTAIVATTRVVENYCVRLCEDGAAQGIPADQCVVGGQVNPALPDHPLCRLAKGLVTSGLSSLSLYALATYTITAGSPITAGTFTPQTFVRPRLTRIPMWVVRPIATSSTATFPVVVFQHGLGSVKEAGFYIANTLANTKIPGVAPDGFATVMIDLPFHGARASDIQNNTTGVPCPGVDPAQITCDLAGACTAAGGGMVCDGLRDDSGSGFLGVNLFATRDNFRQGTVDQLTLLRTLRLEGRAGGALADLVGSRLAYIGQSLGGITGGNLAAYVGQQEMQAMVLNVGGGGLANNILLNTVPDISGPLFAGLTLAGVCQLKNPQNPAAGCKDTPAFRQFLVIAQWVLDPGDPLANAAGVTAELRAGRTPLGPAKILMQMSQPDLVVSNQSSLALAAAYGFRAPGSPLANHFQTYDFRNVPAATMESGCHPYLLAPVCGQCIEDSVCQTLGAQIQAATFVASGGTVVSEKTTAVPGLPFNCAADPCQ